ncbi:hypothetical protein D8B23_20930 [Verminephrobacter aporrectodeae subsp. tuberculatae]|nr:hypothetical protein [Verminephrobacter aporrectodeae subsp. tuberculatae]
MQILLMEEVMARVFFLRWREMQPFYFVLIFSGQNTRHAVRRRRTDHGAASRSLIRRSALNQAAPGE